MKKQFFLVPVLGLILTGCASDEPMPGNQGGNANTEPTNYLAINMVTPPATPGTRAETLDDIGGSQSYKDGTDIENNVNAVRFFFFDDGSNATPVWKLTGTSTETQETYESYIDWYPTQGDISAGDPSMTVEKILTTTLGIIIPEGAHLPEQVVAVINPTPEILAITNTTPKDKYTVVGPNLSQLTEEVADYYTGLHGGSTPESGNFVMTNSVYAQNTEQGMTLINTTALSDDNFVEKLEEAEDNAVEIYVERILARIDFGLFMTENENMETETVGEEGNQYTIYKVSNQVIDDETGDDGKGMDIYVKILGWNLSATTNQSNFLKDIDPSWTNTALFNNNSILWNTADYHRSFWAMNPSVGVEYQYGNFGTNNQDGFSANSLPIPAAGEYTVAYMQENASPYSTSQLKGPETATKFIIAAQLVDKEGESIPLAEYNYKKYTVDGLKNYLADQVLSNIYKRSNGDNPTFTKIKPSDITFKTAVQIAENDNAVNEDGEPLPKYGITINPNNPEYYVYVVLADLTGTGYSWQIGNQVSGIPMTIQQTNQEILNRTHHAMVWNTGYTYFFDNIHHLGAIGSVGYNGVIRNHIYQTKVTSISGLGTPVYNPDQVIHPQQPEYSESILMAKINILQWRIVSQEYELTW